MDTTKKAAVAAGAAVGSVVAVAGAPLWTAIAAGAASALAAPKAIDWLAKLFK